MTDDSGLSERMVYLKALQQKRLQETYADFIAQEEYAETCAFFFGKVYTTEDSSVRDQAVERFYGKLKRVLGGKIIQCLGQIISLQKLTVALDERLADVLIEMDAPIECDIETYEQAYRESDNYDDRVRQIEILHANLRLAHQIFHRFGVGTGLKALHEFERVRGRHGRVTGFLLDAYHAIHPLRDIGPLAEAINERERLRLDRIYER